MQRLLWDRTGNGRYLMFHWLELSHVTPAAMEIAENKQAIHTGERNQLTESYLYHRWPWQDIGHRDFWEKLFQ